MSATNVFNEGLRRMSSTFLITIPIAIGRNIKKLGKDKVREGKI